MNLSDVYFKGDYVERWPDITQIYLSFSLWRTFNKFVHASVVSRRLHYVKRLNSRVHPDTPLDWYIFRIFQRHFIYSTTLKHIQRIGTMAQRMFSLISIYTFISVRDLHVDANNGINIQNVHSTVYGDIFQSNRKFDEY